MEADYTPIRRTIDFSPILPFSCPVSALKSARGVFNPMRVGGLCCFNHSLGFASLFGGYPVMPFHSPSFPLVWFNINFIAHIYNILVLKYINVLDR